MLFPKINLLPLELLLDVIIKKYLAESYCISFVSETPLTFQSPVGFTYLIPDEQILVKQLLKVSEMGCSDYIVHMREPQKFMSAFEKVIHLSNIRRSNRKIVFLSHVENWKDVNLASKVFTMKESAFVANMIMVAYSNKSLKECVTFDLVTHMFVGTDDQTNVPLYLDSWNSCDNKFEIGANLFPYDMTNLFGKTLKVACFTYKPYVLLDLDTAVEPLGRDGIEVRIIDEFCRWVNCTIKIVQEEANQWGEVYENETGGIGVIGSVVADRADMGITALYSWYEEWRVMDFSVSGVRTAITCVAPAPRLLSSWEMPFMPFTWKLWLAVIFTFFYASIGLAIAEEFCTESRPFLTVFGMMIAQSQSEFDVSWKVRSVTGWLQIVGLILGCAYGAGLATTFTLPIYEPSIDTVKDIVDRGTEWGATHDAWIFSLTLSSDTDLGKGMIWTAAWLPLGICTITDTYLHSLFLKPLVKKLLSQFRIYSSHELRRKSKTRSMAFSIEKLPAGHFAIGEYLSKEAVVDMMLMLEDFYYEQCVIMMRKSSPYSEKISELIGRLHQSGLLLAWETQVALKHLDYEVQLEVRLSRYKNEAVTKPLSASYVVGIFMMYTTGVIISTAIFLGELLWHWFISGKNLNFPNNSRKFH